MKEQQGKGHVFAWGCETGKVVEYTIKYVYASDCNRYYSPCISAFHLM